MAWFRQTTRVQMTKSATIFVKSALTPKRRGAPKTEVKVKKSGPTNLIITILKRIAQSVVAMGKSATQTARAGKNFNHAARLLDKLLAC